MSKRPSMVDFGPVSLPTHLTLDGLEPGLIASSSRSEDAMKLQRLIGSGTGGHDGAEADDIAGPIHQSVHPGFRGSLGSASAKVLSGLRMAASIATSSVSVARRVELELNPDFLPQSSLSVERTSDGLYFELHVQQSTLLEDISQDLERIVSSVGVHLQTPVTLRLFAHSPPILVKEGNWCSGRA